MRVLSWHHYYLNTYQNSIQPHSHISCLRANDPMLSKTNILGCGFISIIAFEMYHYLDWHLEKPEIPWLLPWQYNQWIRKLIDYVSQGHAPEVATFRQEQRIKKPCWKPVLVSCLHAGSGAATAIPPSLYFDFVPGPELSVDSPPEVSRVIWFSFRSWKPLGCLA